jgi:hypothetical protein
MASEGRVRLHSVKTPWIHRIDARGVLLVIGILALTAALAPVAWASDGAIERVSAGPIGGNGAFNAEVAGGYAFDTVPSGVSEDGSRLFFLTDEQLVDGDTDSSRDLYERENGVTTLVSDDDSASIDPDLAVTYAGISADGTSVFFTTTEQLTPDAGPSDGDGEQDVYVRDDGVLRLVSVGDVNGSGPFGAQLVSYYMGTRYASGTTTDGEYAVFSTAEQLTADDIDNSIDLYGRALASGVTERLSKGPDDASGNGAFDASFGGMSQDGTRVFLKTAEQLTLDDTDGSQDVYERLPGSGTTNRLSRGNTAGSGNGAFAASFGASSIDGTRVFFQTSERIDAGDGDSVQDVYVRDLNTSTTSLVSDADFGAGEVQSVEVTATGGTFELTFDGQTTGDIGFDATPEALQTALEGLSNIAPGDVDVSGTPGSYTVTFEGNLYASNVPEMTADSTLLDGDVVVQTVSEGREGCSCSGNAAIPASFARSSEDGTKAFFVTGEQLAATDTDNATDIYMGSGGTTLHISQGAINGNGGFNATFTNGIQFDVSADGSHVFFHSGEALAPGGGGLQDVYERFGSTTTLISGNGPGVAYFVGASADGTKAGIISYDSLTSADTDGGHLDGYEWVGGILILATIGPTNDGVPDNAPVDVNNSFGGGSRDGSRVFFQTPERLTAEDSDSAQDVYYLGASDGLSATAPPGGTVSTGGAPTPTDPLETDVTPPGGGSVQITEVAPSQATPSGYSLLGYQASITATPNTPPTASNPIVITFRIDASLLPAGYDESAPDCGGESISQCVQVFRNGVEAGNCASPGVASPSPCVDSRTQPGGAGSDIEITVLTLSASEWNFGVPKGKLVVVEDTRPDDSQDLDFTTDGHLSPTSFSLDDDSDGTLSNTRTFDNLSPGDHYSITETPTAGWVLTSATCGDGSPVSNIEISPGETVTCTFTNYRADLGTCEGKVATIIGTDASESLTGTAGDDVIVGLGGNDTISGAGGNDAICGGDGNDSLNGGAGADVLSGQVGLDTATYATRTTAVRVDLDNVADDGDSSDGPATARDNVKSDVENLIGGSGADKLTGSAANNRLTGGLGADSLSGLGGNDNLFANDGIADTKVDCDGGTTDTAHVDSNDPATVGCETVGL